MVRFRSGAEFSSAWRCAGRYGDGMARALPVLHSVALPSGSSGDASVGKERKDARENRVRILAAAKKLMKKRPLDEICMDEVAALAGVGKGTLYRRFADRAALLLALLDEAERELQDLVIAGLGLPRTATACDRLSALYDAMLSFALDHARVLAAAEASARAGSRFDHPTYQWRHTAIAHGLAELEIAHGEHAGHVADVVLASLSGEVLARALSAQPRHDVEQQTRALFASIVGAHPRRGLA
jgi:AcrR family transcriptional regulator